MKTLLRLLVCTFIVLAGFTSVKAQDIHFSQFYMSPLNLNPAMTGVMNCKTRFVANYRNQWASVLKANAYNTYSASYDQKVPVGREDYFGIGGSLWGDVAGESRFGTTQGRLSLSYSKKMAGYRKKSSYLVIGVDGGMTQRRISDKDLRWPSQITTNGFDPQLLPNEAGFTDFDFLFADLGAGLLWFSVIDKNTNYYLGAALHHLNQPDVSFLGSVESLYTKVTLHGGAQFEIQPKISLLPYIVYMAQGQHRELNGGASVRFALGPSRLSNQSWQLGAWYRLGSKDEGGIHSDAVILSSRFDYENFGIGFSYDVNISKLSSAGSANGAFEFSLQYLICGPENRGVYCPRF
jgi:type IX secretion system PorP/SprF family membrane protein|tara:strand:+ start:391 stop:1440 length:1050 start_codon:yes stop_codon:yes gene_type:complete